VIAVALQNDFLEERPADGTYAAGASRVYPTAAKDLTGANVRRGGACPLPLPLAHHWSAQSWSTSALTPSRIVFLHAGSHSCTQDTGTL
jgi:hypothetical protein